MRNRTRLIAAAVAVTAALAGTAGTAMAATNCPKAGTPAKTVSVTSKQPTSLNALAARLGVSPERLDRVLREVKTSLGKAGGTPTQRQFEAALARVLGIPLARVRHAFPPGALGAAKPGGPKADGGKEADGKGAGAKPPHSKAPTQPTGAAFAATVASELNLSTAQVKAALAPLLAAGGVDTSSASFAAAAQMSLRARVAIAVGVVVFCALAIVAAVVYPVVGANLHAQDDESLMQVADNAPMTATKLKQSGAVLGQLVPFGDAQLQILPEPTPGSFGGFVDVTDHDMAVALGEDQPYFRDEAYNGIDWRIYTTAFPGNPGALVRAAMPASEADSTQQALGWLLLALVPAAAIGAAALARLAAGRVLRPVGRLTETVERIRDTGDLSAPIETPGQDEISRLGQAFAAMTAALDESVGAQRRLVGDASHELRTPLTSLITNLELLAEQPGDPSAPAFIAAALAEAVELRVLINDLVELARDGQASFHMEDVRLDLVAKRVAARAAARSPGPRFELDCRPTLVLGDPDALERAIGNLVDNALKWSPPGGRVRITAADGTVAVSDEGPGIPAADLPYIFDRFYRSVQARSLPGSGLGLAIVRRITDLHAGTVEAIPLAQGVTFRISLPEAPVASVLTRQPMTAPPERNGRERVTLTSRLYGAVLKGEPAVTRAVDVRRDMPVRAPDGTALLTDVYLARPGRPLPVILIRSPYGRGPAGTIARLFAERGYHAVIQSTRGTFGSGGRIDFDAEAADGRSAADWIIGQPWSDGTIGTFGGSYLSLTQLALASTRPPQLKAMALSVWGADRREYKYPGGAFTLEQALGWVVNVEYQERPLGFLRAPLHARKALVPAFGHLPLLGADTVAVGHPVSFYRDWVTHDEPGDPHWAPTDFRPILKDLGVPVTMLAGWYDMFLPQMLADYEELRDGGQDVRLRVGAWHHTSRGLFAQSIADALDWFGTHLLGRAPSAGQPRLRVEVMGGSGWRSLPEWPPPGAAVQRWHLHPGGVLGTGAPADGGPSRYTYDPADPTPSAGGAAVMNAGPVDNRAVEQRPDVLTYTSEPVASPLVITGPVTAELFAASSRPHTDFFARLCDVDPGGKSVNITDGILRLTSATEEPQRVAIDLWPTAHQFQPGHRIRLQVSSGAHPRYARNPGSGEPLATATTLHTAQQAVYHDRAHPSAILLPVLATS